MRAGAKTPLVLAALALVLGAYLLIFEHKHETTDEARASHQRLFAKLNRDDVTAIEIERGAKGRVTLTRAPASGGAGAWRVDPGGVPAANGAAADLLDVIDGLDVDRVATAPAKGAGLEPPAVQVTISSAAGRFVLEAGNVDASGRGVFVRRGGDARVFVVDRRVRDLVDRDAGAFRDRTLFAPNTAETATTLAFRSDARDPRTLRKRAGFWLDEEGVFAARAAVSEALRTLTALDASGFPSPAPAGPASAPQRRVELTTTATTRLEIWNDSCAVEAGAATRLAALTAPSAGKGPEAAREWICLDAGAVDRLWRQLEAANRRDPYLLIVDPPGVDGITLSEGDRRVRLRRGDDGAWQFVEPKVTYEADAKVIADWLGQLAKISLADGGPATRAKESGPSRHLVVEGATRAEIEVARAAAGYARVMRVGEGTPARVDATAFEELDPEPLRFRSRAVLSLPQFDVTGMEIHAPGEHVSLSRKAGNDWVRAGDGATTNPAPESRAVDHLVEILSDLRAQRFVTPQPKSFTPETTVDLEVREGTSPVRHHRLEIAARCRARVADVPVFSLPAKTCDDLREAIERAR